MGLIDHYRIVRAALYQSFSAAPELADSNSLTLLAGRLHENFRDCGRLTGELQRGSLLNVQNHILTNNKSPLPRRNFALDYLNVNDADSSSIIFIKH